MKKNNKNSSWCENVSFISTQEDRLIVDLVAVHGTKNWAKIADELNAHGHKNKTGKQCRERWFNHVDPQLNKHWTLN